MKKILLGASALMFLGVLTLNSNQGEEITFNEALAAGTCCPGVGTCYPDTGGYQYDHWWRTDGKPCNAEIKKEGF